MPAVGLMRNLRLHAADDAVLTCILQRNASVHHSGNDGFVIVHCGIAKTQSCKLAGSEQELVRSVHVITDGEGRCGQLYVCRSFDTHIGDVVGHIQTFFVRAADTQVLEHRVACEGLSGNLVTGLIDVV